MLIFAVLDTYQSDIDLFTIYEYAHGFFEGRLNEIYNDGEIIDIDATFELYNFDSDDLSNYMLDGNMVMSDTLWEIENWADLVKIDKFVYDKKMTESMKEDYLEDTGLELEGKVYVSNVSYHDKRYEEHDRQLKFLNEHKRR